MAEESGWCTIESDPGVFTELLTTIGVPNVQVEELYTLPPPSSDTGTPPYGLVFLFRYDPKLASTRKPSGNVVTPPDGLFFANQTITNACATQAILSVVMNVPGLAVGAELERFREFARGMDPVTTGMVVGNSDVIREAHNSFAVVQPFVVEDGLDGREKEEPFHFVAYVPFGGVVYELDGLQEGPVEIGKVGDQCWTEVAVPVIEARMKEYGDGEGEIRFNLMKVVEDPRERLRKELGEIGETGDRRVEIERELERVEALHAGWKVENERRRFNFVPFIVTFLKALARAGRFAEVAETARAKKRQALRRAEEKGNGAGDAGSK